MGCFETLYTYSGYFSIDSSHTPDKGPNGSGKSTIVCALYLVFNGKVNNLGRGTSIAQVGFHTITVAKARF